MTSIQPRNATREELLSFHSESYLEYLSAVDSNNCEDDIMDGNKNSAAEYGLGI